MLISDRRYGVRLGLQPSLARATRSRAKAWPDTSHHATRTIAPTTGEQVSSSLEDMARALAADFEFDHVDHGWNEERERNELTIVVAGNKYGVLLQYVVAARTGLQPPVTGHVSAVPVGPEFAYEVFAEWDDQGRCGFERVALCDDDTTVLALLRGLRAEYAAREGAPLNTPEQPGWARGD